MKNKTLLFNPAAGGKDSISTAALKEMGFDGEIIMARKEGDVYALAKELASQYIAAGMEDKAMLAVYGGDGTVMEAARALYGTKIALAIIPGGTANVMAKELKIPLQAKDAVDLLATDYRLRPIDMGLVNGCPFLIRVNMGLFSDMITETNPDLKEKWGQLAYGLTAFQTLGREAVTFRLNVDGQALELDAVALTVTNAGNVGRTGYSFLPDILVDDGWLDIIALDKADIGSLLRVSGSILLQKDSAVLKHWKAKEVSIRLPEGSSWLCDDTEENAIELNIKIAPASLQVVTQKDTHETH